MESAYNSFKVGDTITAVTTPENATNVAGYKWETLETAVATEGTEVGNTASLVVTDSMKGKYIRVTVTDTAGTPFTAISDTAVIEDNSGDVKIINNWAFQSDGTAVVGDQLQVSYGSSFGAPKSITWYLNDVVAAVNNSNQGGIDLTYNPNKAGTVYAVITGEDGKTYTSKNTVVVVEDQLAPTISGFEIVNDYDGKTLTAATADSHAIAKLTVSKWYAGKYYIFKKGVDYTTTNKFDDAFTSAGMTPVTKSTFTTKQLETGAGVTPADGIYYQEDNGVTHFMWEIDADPVRGTEYVIAFDQTALSSDDISTSKNDKINMAAESAVAPYLVAPSAIELKTPTAGVGTYEITFKNGDKQYEGLTEATASSFATTVVYTKKTADAASASSVGTVNTAFEDGKVKQTELTNAVKTQVYYVESNLKAGIFDKASVKVTSAEVTCGTPASGKITVTKDSDVATTAKVTFKTKTLDAGVLYITKDLTKFKAADSGSYTASVEVAKDATEAKVANAFDEGGKKYYAVFVPATTDTYSNVESEAYTYAKGTVDRIDFATVSGVTGASKGVELSSKIVATDAFGYGTECADVAANLSKMWYVDETAAPFSLSKATTTAADYDALPTFAVDGATGTVTFTVGGDSKKNEVYAMPLEVGTLVAKCTAAGSAESSEWEISYTTDALTIYDMVPAAGGIVTGGTASTTAIKKLADKGWTVKALTANTLPATIAAGSKLEVGAAVAFAAAAAGTTNKGTIKADITGGSFTTSALTNEGTIDILTGTTTFTGGLKNTSDGTINIAGTLKVTTTALENAGTINNKGTLDVDIASASAGTIAGKNGVIDVAGAILTISDGDNELGTVNGAGTGLTISGGTNKIAALGDNGTGTAQATVTSVTGGTTTITALNSTGTLTINGTDAVVSIGTFTKTGNLTVTAGTLKFTGAVADGANTTDKIIPNGGTVDFSEAAVTADFGIAEPTAASKIILPVVTASGIDIDHAASTANLDATNGTEWYYADGTTKVDVAGDAADTETVKVTSTVDGTPAVLSWAWDAL